MSEEPILTRHHKFTLRRYDDAKREDWDGEWCRYDEALSVIGAVARTVRDEEQAAAERLYGHRALPPDVAEAMREAADELSRFAAMILVMTVDSKNAERLTATANEVTALVQRLRDLASGDGG